MLVVEGATCDDFKTTAEKYSSLASLFPFQLEVSSPLTYNSTVPDELSILAVSSRRQKKLKENFGKVNKACQLGEAFKVVENADKIREDEKRKEKTKTARTTTRDNSLKLKLLLSLAQMIDENYPILLEGPMAQKYVDYVMSKDEYTEVTENSPLFAVDCEMCLTSVGKLELTKVCVVDSDLNEVYHSFVKPRNPIVNYLTRFSGITPALLQVSQTIFTHVGL